MTIRLATPADLSAMKKIMLSGLASDPSWNYCFPGGRGGAAQVTEDALKRWLEASRAKRDRWMVTVADDPDTRAAVALAIWSLPAPAPPAAGAPSSSSGEDDDDLELHAVLRDCTTGPTTSDPDDPEASLSAARLNALADAVRCTARLRGSPVFERNGPQMVLLLTATLPSYRFRAFAKALCSHGTAQASKRGLPVSALASPMGYIFYSGMGFSDCGLVTVQVPGEQEKLELKAMVLAAPERKASISQQLLGLFGLGSGNSSKGRRRPSTQASAPHDNAFDTGMSKVGS